MTELKVEFEEGLSDQLELGNLLIRNYVSRKCRIRRSRLEPEWVLDEALIPFNCMTIQAPKFQNAIYKAWTSSSYLHASRTFVVHVGISKPLIRNLMSSGVLTFSMEDSVAAMSPTYFVKFGKYRSTVNFKVFNYLLSGI